MRNKSAIDNLNRACKDIIPKLINELETNENNIKRLLNNISVPSTLNSEWNKSMFAMASAIHLMPTIQEFESIYKGSDKQEQISKALKNAFKSTAKGEKYYNMI